MADNKLEIEVGVKVDDLTKGIAKSKAELDKLKEKQRQLDAEFKKGIRTEQEYYQQTVKNGTAIKKLTQRINTETNALIRLDNAQDQVGTGMKKITKATSANATPALQEFSRVIQDAPYGIQGVGNNITQLVSQFGYLSKATGGAKNALKAMLGSLAGSGGILFAISTLVSLMTVYGDEIMNFISGTDSATDSLSDEAKELEKVTKELTGYYDAITKATEGTAAYNGLIESATSLDRKLDKALSNTNLTEKERQELINKRLDSLKLEAKAQKLKERLINGENSAIQDNIDANKKYRAGVQATIKELEAKNKLTKQEKLTLDQLRKSLTQYNLIIDKHNDTIQNNYEEYGKLVTELKKVEDEFDNISTSLAEGSIGWYKNEISLLKQQQELVKTRKEFELLGKQIDILKQKLSELSGERPKVKSIKSKSAGVDTGFASNMPDIPAQMLQSLDSNTHEKLQKAMYASAKRMGDAGAKGVKDGGDSMLTSVEDLGVKLDQILASNLASAFVDMGKSIGNALSGAGSAVDKLGNVLLSSIGGLMTALGEQLITMGIASEAMAKLLKFFGISGVGIGGIIAGTALVALGSAVSSAGQKGIQDTASSYSGTGSSVGGNGSSGSRYSSSNYSSGGMGSGNVVFEIQGTKLVGVLNNTLKRNKSLGGTNNLLFT